MLVTFPEHAFTLGHPQELLVEYFFVRLFWRILKKKIVKFRIGENYLARRFSFICLVTFQYLVYDTKIMMGGGVEMYAISPEE